MASKRVWFTFAPITELNGLPCLGVYSIFASSSKQSAASTTTTTVVSATGAGTSSEPFQWLKPSLGPRKTCLHGVNLAPPFRSSIAAFDLDGTVIESAHKKRASTEWKWWSKIVPVKLKSLYEEG